MTSYRDQKVQEAIQLAQGDPQQAQRVLATWAQRDEKLLRALVLPFLPGIVAHAIQHGGKIVPTAAAPAPAAARKRTAPPSEMPAKALDNLIQQLGRNFEASKGPLGIGRPTPARRETSARHAETMRSLAKAFGKQRTS